MNSSFVAVVSDEIRRFLETETTQRAAGIHIPLPGLLFWRSLSCFATPFNKRTANRQKPFEFNDE